MVSGGYTKRELLTTLPELPAPSGKKLADSVIHGIRTSFRNTWVLILQDYKSLHNISFVPDPKVDIRTKNAARRKAMTLDAAKQGFMRSLNLSLRGGEDYPVLTSVLGPISNI